MKNAYGVIDLGTNTFHLLIAEEKSDGSFKELYRNRIFVKLAEEGIHQIGKAPFQRGLNAIAFFKKIIDQHEVKQVRAFGTAALRTASNGQDFIRQVAEESDLEIQIIPGTEEARLIHLGVSQAISLGTENGLIMDIGGGSVEFIIANCDQVLWAQSFPVGVAVLHQEFHQHDPINPTEIHAIENYLQEQLQPLFQALQQNPARLLIGASGTFDVLEDVLSKERYSPVHSEVEVADFYPLSQKLIASSLAERLAMPDIPESRVDLIVVAIILIRIILEQAKIQRISVSGYAMKEGILKEMMASDRS